VLTVAIPSTDFTRDDLVLGFERAYWERFEVELEQMRALVMSLRVGQCAARRPGAAGPGSMGRGTRHRSIAASAWPRESGSTARPSWSSSTRPR
jgi:hypothetical protein